MIIRVADSVSPLKKQIQKLNVSALEATERAEANNSLIVSEIRSQYSKMKRRLRANRFSMQLNSITGLRVMAPLKPRYGVSTERANTYSVKARHLREEKKLDLTQLEISQVTLEKEEDNRLLVRNSQVSSQEHLEKIWSNQLIEKLKYKNEKSLQDPVKESTKRDIMQVQKTTEQNIETWKELDKYIEEILEHGESKAAKFLYFNIKPNSINPYDLDLTTFNNRNAVAYYVISAKGVTHYKNDKALDFIPLSEWLVQRDLYSNIKELTFFKHFKRWKLLKIWRQRILIMKRKKILDELNDKLFFVDEKYRSFILKHKKATHEMSKLRFISVNKQTASITLKEFLKNQRKKETTIAEELKEYSNNCSKGYKKLMKSVLDVLKGRVKENTGKEESEKPKGNGGFEALGFPANLAYGHRAALRRECMRFLRLAHLIDFMSTKALGDIYLDTIREMIDSLRTLNNKADMKISIEQDILQKISNKEPILQISVNFNPQLIQQQHIISTQINEFSERNSKPKDFNLFSHIELKSEEKESRSLKKYYKPEVPDIVDLWLSLKPMQEEFIGFLNTCIENGLKVLLSFKRWGKNKELTVYANVLEDWDMIVDGVWEPEEHSFLDLMSCIADQEVYKSKDRELNGIITSAYKKANDFLKIFKKYLYFYWMNESADFGLLFNDSIVKPIDTLTNVLRLLKYQRDKFSLKVPESCNVGILKIDCTKVRKSLLPSSITALKEIERIGGSILREKAKDIRKWVINSMDQLMTKVTTVDDYVKQKNSWNNITDSFQKRKDQLDLYGNMYGIMRDFSLNVRKEDRSFYNETLQEMTKLSQLIANVADQQELQLDSIKKELNDVLILELNEKLEKLQVDVKDEKFLNKSQTVSKTIKDVELLEETFKICESLSKKYNSYKQTLNMEASEFGLVEEIREELGLRSDLWKSLQKWGILIDRWNGMQFNSISLKEISTKTKEFLEIAKRTNQGLPENTISKEFESTVERFQKVIPIVNVFKNEMLGKHHWQEIKSLLGCDFDIESVDFTLKSLLDMNVIEYQEELEHISQRACQESALKQQLLQLDDLWKRIVFTVKPYKYKDTYILEEPEVVLNATDESLASVNGILGSRYVKPLLGQAEGWRNSLLNLQGIMDEWITCQKRWVYLENIFSGQDIKKQLVNEAIKFEMVDKFFRRLMMRAFKMSHPLKLIKALDKNFLETLKHHNKTLDEIEKLLEDFLQLKRKSFPRFYFLSNDELLQIIANQQNLEVIQRYLGKCFGNLHHLDIQENLDVTAMYSVEGECISFPRPTRAKDNAEVWLDGLQVNIRDTLIRAIKGGFVDYDVTDREQWVLKHNSQIVGIVAQISWTSITEAAILELPEYPTALIEWYEENIEQIQMLVDLIRTKLHPIKRKILTSLIITDTHSRDILELLVLNNTSQLNDFNWQRQLRFYWDDEDPLQQNKGCYVKQVAAKLDYGYEYIGPSSRLVITPLTDRCWISITGSLTSYLGTALTGSEGKSESVKDLAKALAMYCVVFNCSETINYKMMGRLLAGVMQQGAWICFAEFDRIGVEVLSVVARQMMNIRTALIKGDQTLIFEEKEIALKSCGIFITMNSKTLPGNLRANFRLVAMMIPESEILAEVMLFAEGFNKSKVLAKKIVKLFKLASDILSQQVHYTFGIHLIKSVLMMAGRLKREEPQLSEEVMIVKAIHSLSISKLVKKDLVLFNALIKDMFPTLEFKSVIDDTLKKQIQNCMVKKYLQVIPAFTEKVIQLNETLNIYAGTIIIGPTGSGKTTCFETLKNSLTSLHINIDIINPKAITLQELYGEYNAQEWRDGLASRLIRRAAEDTSDEYFWIVFDGPIDSSWIESMNNALDYSKAFCLSDGERIKLNERVKILFEVEDLVAASPSTIGKCGMVYIGGETVGWMSFVQSWVERTFVTDEILTRELKEMLLNLFNQSVERGLTKIRSGLIEPIKTIDLQLVEGICNFLEVFLTAKYFAGDSNAKKEALQSIFMFSFVWGLASSVDEPSKDKVTFLLYLD